jgi:hypothetical protein
MKQNKIPRNEYIRKPVGKTNPYKEDVIYSNLGQWKYPGQVTRIPSGDITMQGVPYPVYGEDDLGYSQMMYPGMDYQFPGQYVTEYPMAMYGGDPSLSDITGHYQVGGAQTPEEWEKEIRSVEHKIGHPSQWTLEGYKELQNKLNEYKAWRENTPKGKAVIDYHNEPNEYVVPLPSHLQVVPKKPFGGQNTKTHTHMSKGGWLDEYQKKGEVRQPYIYKKPEEKEESRTVVYTDKAAFDKAYKAEMDSLNVRKEYPQSFYPGSKTRPLTKEEKEYYKDEKTGLVPNLVEYRPRFPNDGYFGHFKKPVIHNVYKEEPPPPPVKKKDKPKEKGLPPGVIRQWNFNSNVGPVMIYKKGDQEVGREYYRDGKPYETHYGDPTGKTTIDTIPFDPARIKKEGGWLDEYQIRGEVLPSETTQSMIPAYMKSLPKSIKEAEKKQKLINEGRVYEKAIQDVYYKYHKNKADKGSPLALGRALALGVDPIEAKSKIEQQNKDYAVTASKEDTEEYLRPVNDEYLKEKGLEYASYLLGPEMLEAKTLAKPYLNKASRFLNRFKDDVVQAVDEEFITPLQFIKDINKIKGKAAKQHEYFQKPEIVEKLKNLGASPEIIKGLQTPGQIDVSFAPRIGSHYNPSIDAINIDMRQAKQLMKEYGLTPEQIYEHEVGHQLQKRIFQGSPEYQERLKDYNDELAQYMQDLEYYNQKKAGVTTNSYNTFKNKFIIPPIKPVKPVPYSKPTILDKQAAGMLRLRAKDKNILTPDQRDILRYYHSERPDEGTTKIGYDIEQGVERLAHLREMRQAMIDSKIIKDATEPITENMVKKFVQENPKNRIVQFMDPNFQTNYKKLVKLFKGLPAAAPIGLGAAAYQQEEEGGEIGEDDFRRGGPYTPPKLKRKVKKQGTSKNIQSSINKLFTRNYDVFGPSGKNIYNPNVYKTGGWLDNLD